MQRTRVGSDIFAYYLIYRLIIGIRVVFDDTFPAIIFFAAALGWQAAFNRARPLQPQIAVPPAAIAAVIFAVGLRIGRSAGGDLAMPGLVRRSVLYAGAIVLAALSLGRCAGGVLACYAPLGAAIVLSWRWRKARQGRSRHALRRPTRAGFGPSFSALLSLSARTALSVVDTIDTRTALYSASSVDSTGAEQTIEFSTALFRARGDHRSEAYCLARNIELSLTRSDIAAAEALSREIADDEYLIRQPAALAARAEYLAAVGQHGQALTLLLQARDLARRAPVRLQARVLEVAVDAHQYDRADQRAWSAWRRVLMIWSGEVASALVGVASSLSVLARDDPERALEVGYQLCRVPDRLLAHVPSDVFELTDYQRALVAKGLALDTIARIHHRQGRLMDASAASLDAYESYNVLKNSQERVRAARSFVLSLAYALGAGHKEPAQESHALDLMRALLQVLEDDRGSLLDEDSRSSWIEDQRDLYQLVFGELSRATYDLPRAGEIGFWLLESMHRTMTAGLVAEHGVLDPSPPSSRASPNWLTWSGGCRKTRRAR